MKIYQPYPPLHMPPSQRLVRRQHARRLARRTRAADGLFHLCHHLRIRRFARTVLAGRQILQPMKMLSTPFTAMMASRN